MSYTEIDVWQDCFADCIKLDVLKQKMVHVNTGTLEEFTEKLSSNGSHIKLLHYLLNEIAFKNDSNIYEYMLEISQFHNNEDEEACIIIKRHGCTEIFGDVPIGMKVISSGGKDIDRYDGL